MNTEVQLIWQEVLADFSTPVAMWQLAIIVIAIGIAFAINGALRAYVIRHANDDRKLAIGGVNRILFPISTLIMVQFAKLIMGHWQHTSILHLASTLFLAMAVVRLLVYAVRYIIAPGGVLKTVESSVSGLIWIVLALHLTGLLPQVFDVLTAIEFTVGKVKINLLLILQAGFIIFATIFVALWCSRIVENRLMRNDNINMNMRVVLSKVVRIAFIFIAVLIGLSAVGLDFTLFSVFGGALGVGLGFGLQRIASNYVSGFILLLDNSIKIGDIITVNELHYGIIADLRTRYLVLKKLDGTEVIVPNEMLITNTVINHSFLDRNTRVVMDVQVAYQSDLELVMQLMRDAAESHSRVLLTPAPTSAIKAFADSGVDMTLSVWIADPENGQLVLKSEIFLAIWKLFKANNISIPFPQREIKILNQESIIESTKVSPTAQDDK
jgi:small-conductance mechanosensitive channel